MLCPHRQGGWASTDDILRARGRSQFFLILCERPLWTDPVAYAEISKVGRGQKRENFENPTRGSGVWGKSHSPTLSVKIHHKFRKIRSFLRQKVRTSSFETPSPLPEKYPPMTNPLPLDCGLFQKFPLSFFSVQAIRFMWHYFHLF